MIKDFRYIIKRVIIGVLICIVFSCFNSCKVNALELDNYVFDFDYLNGQSYDMETFITNYCSNYDSYFIVNSTYKAPYSNIPFPENIVGNNYSMTFMCFNKSSYTNSNLNGKVAFYNNGSLGFSNNLPGSYLRLLYKTNSHSFEGVISSDIINIYNGNVPFENKTISVENRNTNRYQNAIYENTTNYPVLTQVGGSESILDYYLPESTLLYTNLDEVYLCSSSTLSGCNENNITLLYSQQYNKVEPKIIDINYAPLIKNNILVEVSLFPQFNVFDIENYDYQYGFTSDNEFPNTWLSLDNNYQWLQFRANGTFFVRIKDKSNDEIIATSTFTIDNMGRPVEDEDAYIDISSEYRTRNFLNNNISSGSYSNIAEVQLYLDYNPKSSFYRYFYQYIPVENGEYATEPNNNNWEELASSNNGSRTYVVSENGILFAKMEDIDGNVVATANYKVENIGDLASDNPNENNTNAWYNRIGKKLNFGGPIGSLINIPITLLRTIYNGINGVGGVCYNYNLGSLWGTNLSLPCVNLSSYLGPLYTTIDIICSGVMIYFIFKMLSMAYDKFLRMERDPLSAEDFYRDNKD